MIFIQISTPKSAHQLVTTKTNQQIIPEIAQNEIHLQQQQDHKKHKHWLLFPNRAF